jgi:ParB-like nuclease domain.
MNSFDQSQSSDDFNKARTRAVFQRLFNNLQWKNANLLSLYEVTSIIKPKEETYEGMKTIDVDKIVGSEGRYRDFSAAFYPRREMLRARWESVDRAHNAAVILPPISVYEISGVYFVRDGNHRVSVAKAQGVKFIDAEVVKLDSQIKLEPGMTMKELKHRVVTYERNQFLTQYKPTYLPMGEIVFTSPGAYPEMVNHILVHKYYINQNRKDEIPFEDAARSWYENVYAPIAAAIRKHKLLSLFPGNTEADLYLWLVRRWDEKKHSDKNATIEEVAEAMEEENKKQRVGRKIKYLAGLLKKN